MKTAKSNIEKRLVEAVRETVDRVRASKIVEAAMQKAKALKVPKELAEIIKEAFAVAAGSGNVKWREGAVFHIEDGRVYVADQEFIQHDADDFNDPQDITDEVLRDMLEANSRGVKNNEKWVDFVMYHFFGDPEDSGYAPKGLSEKKVKITKDRLAEIIGEELKAVLEARNKPIEE